MYVGLQSWQGHSKIVSQAPKAWDWLKRHELFYHAFWILFICLLASKVFKWNLILFSYLFIYNQKGVKLFLKGKLRFSCNLLIPRAGALRNAPKITRPVIKSWRLAALQGDGKIPLAVCSRGFGGRVVGLTHPSLLIKSCCIFICHYWSSTQTMNKSSSNGETRRPEGTIVII